MSVGGRGSGGHNSKGKLRDVQCARLDVHELAREGKLKLGKRGWLFGTIEFEVTGGPDAQQLVLKHPRKSSPGQPPLDPILQVIGCHWREAPFGGRHLIFACWQCSRSARVLYARFNSTYHQIWFFTCRKCAGITYQSTMGHRWDRSARRIEKLRAKLQWTAGGTVPISRGECTKGLTTTCEERLLTTRACESRGRVTAEKTDQNNIVLTFGGNAETGLRVWGDGQSADGSRARCRPISCF